MAFQVSPGVTWREIDLTQVVVGAGSTSGAYSGCFQWGPVNKVVTITEERDLVARFGKPDADTFQSFFAAANFLAYGTNLQLVRVVSEDALNATADGNGIFIANKDVYDVEFAAGEGSVGPWAAKYPGKLGNSLKVSIADSGNFGGWAYKDLFNSAPGTSAHAERTNASNDELHIVVVDEDGYWTGIKGEVLERFGYVSKAGDAKNNDGTSNYYADVINRRSAYVYWMDHPEGVSNWGDPIDGVTFDSIAYEVVFSTVTGTFTPGELVKRASQTVATITVSSGGSGYTTASATIVAGGVTGTATVTLAEGSVDSITVDDNTIVYTTTPTVTITGDGTGAVAVVSGGVSLPDVTIGTVESFDADSKTLRIVKIVNNPIAGNVLKNAGNTAHGTVSSVVNEAPSVSLAGGVDGNDSVTLGDRMLGYDLFKEDTLDVALIIGGVCDTSLANHIIAVAEFRRDCVAFISPELNDVVNNRGNEVTDILEFRDTLNSSSYAFMDGNYKYQYDKYNDMFRWLPLNADIAGLAVKVDVERDAWFSFAGLNRGQIRNVTKLAFNPNKTDRDNLYKKGVNPVVRFTGEGNVLFGDKTLQTKPSAFDRINVRRLFIVLEKSIAAAAKYQLFEFNDEFTRSQFRNMVVPFLRDVQGRRGIFDFEVRCDSKNNTPQVIDTNNFVADIFIKPARSINFIQLNFVAVGTGASFDEIEVVA